MNMHTFDEVEAINHERGDCLAGCRLCQRLIDQRRARAFEDTIRRIVLRHFDHLEDR